jgi:hypothetical protein
VYAECDSVSETNHATEEFTMTPSIFETADAWIDEARRTDADDADLDHEDETGGDDPDAYAGC